MFLVVLVGLVLPVAVVQEGEVVVGILLGFPDWLDLKHKRDLVRTPTTNRVKKNKKAIMV